MIENSYTLADVVTLVAASHLLTFTVWGLRAIDRQDRREARRRHPSTRHRCAQCAAPILAGQECWNMAAPTCGPCFTGTNPTQKENNP